VVLSGGNHKDVFLDRDASGFYLQALPKLTRSVKEVFLVRSEVLTAVLMKMVPKIPSCHYMLLM